MIKFCSMFSQILKLFPRLEFESLVRRTRAERHARGFSSWDQFVAMLFCQLGRAHSLREICHGLATCEGKLSQLGIEVPARASLASMNTDPGSCIAMCSLRCWIECEPMRPVVRSSASRTSWSAWIRA